MSSNEKLIQGIAEQYGAALKMLEDAIVECNDDLWQDYNHEVVICQVVNHAISSVDFYLSRTKEERDSFHGKYGDDDGSLHEPDKNFTKQQLLEYLEEVKVKAHKRFSEISIEELNEAPIFEWHGTSVSGSLLYNLRHLMLHVGALHVRINAGNKTPLEWVNKIYGDERDRWEEMNNKAMRYYRRKEYADAEKSYLELIEEHPDSLYYYNLACCYSLDGKPQKSIETLTTCLKIDKDNRFKNLATKDSDFASIRELPSFKKLIKN